MTQLEIALSYLEKGLSVIPLKSPSTVNRSKKFHELVQKELENNKALPNPRLEEDIVKEMFIRECKKPLLPWKDFQKRLPTKEEVNHWFNTNPDANIGIVTGVVSNLVVFDLDSKQAEEYAEELGGFPEYTVKVKTGKGYHIYMRHPGGEIKNQVERELTIDIRADGGYVAAPPSLHGSGYRYEWVEGFSIFQIDPDVCRPWMIDYLKDVVTNDSKPNKKEVGPSPIKTEIVQPKEKEVKTNEYTDLLKNGCKQGERNHSTTRLIGHLLKTGMKDTDIWEMIQIWNRDRVNPPLGYDELKNIFESVNALEKKSQTTKIIQIDSLLDDFNKAVSDYQNNYLRIPFGNTNLINLEKMMNGGFAGGCFYFFGGIPSSGKTVLLNNIADNICINNHPVLFFSYDDVKAEIRHRTFSRFAKQPIEDFNKRYVKDIQSICQLTNIKKIMSTKYVVQQMIPVEKWIDLIDQIKQKHGKPPVIIIDYLRKLRTEKNISDERLRVDDLVSKLTEIAKTYNTPVIAISELARDSYKSGQRLSMASFKESGSIEYEASWLGILAAVEEKDGVFILKENWETIIKHDGNVDLIIFKAKRGTGDTGKVSLKVDKNLMTVSDRSIETSQMVKQTIKNPIKTKY
jgi:replicative DNA helicase